MEEEQEKVDDNEDDPNLLILIRILFFTYYASLGSLLPYLPVYYHSLGHGGQVIGMLGAIKPFTTFLVAPLWGIISDSTASPFKVLYFTFFVSLIGQLLVALRHDPPWIMTMVFITALFNAPGTVLRYDLFLFRVCFPPHDSITQSTICFSIIIFPSVKSLIDSMVMSNLKDRSKYGRMRLYGQLGFGVGSSVCGILLSRSTHRPYNPP